MAAIVVIGPHKDKPSPSSSPVVEITPSVKMRFRSSYFPFTELSIDILCSLKGGEVPFGEGDNRLEIVGCCGRFWTAGVRWLPAG